MLPLVPTDAVTSRRCWGLTLLLNRSHTSSSTWDAQTLSSPCSLGSRQCLHSPHCNRGDSRNAERPTACGGGPRRGRGPGETESRGRGRKGMWQGLSPTPRMSGPVGAKGLRGAGQEVPWRPQQYNLERPSHRPGVYPLQCAPHLPASFAPSHTPSKIQEERWVTGTR